MATTIKRTYSARSKASLSSSSPSTTPVKRKSLDTDTENAPPPKKRLASRLKSTGRPSSGKSSQKTLRQLHFILDSSILKTCLLCGLSYTKGAPDDEALHRSHCGRVQRGMEWAREEERESLKAGVEEVAVGVKLKDGTNGRIISFAANVGGRIGTKLANLLETINLALASPPLTDSILQCSKAYLFLIPSVTNVHRERIVGCVIAQRISTAMAIATPEETAAACLPDSESAEASELSPSPTRSLVAVDTSSGLFCHPAALPTPLGIPRLFVSSAHRRQGIASRLLSAAATTFIHGCPLDPSRGDVAFTQPTEGGNAVMRSWGKGFVRIYEE
ncbi:hypothetical protein HYDPIDRAFT_172933 [Hydnomerulius pinastri MD-312]|nr:hypothetical protein HYDPIDRAFT_172933 [Hydnomerulius pinastri MD-312]